MICLEFKLNNTVLKIDFSFFIVLSIALMINNKSVAYLLLFSALHELAHIIVLLIVGGKIDKINFSYYGIGMKHSSDLKFKDEIVFLLSGVGVNLFFAVINVQRQINLSLFLINILPVFPLDGGRILKLILDRVFDFYISYKVFISISILFFVAMMIYAIYNKNFNIILIGIYLFTWIVRGNYD